MKESFIRENYQEIGSVTKPLRISLSALSSPLGKSEIAPSSTAIVGLDFPNIICEYSTFIAGLNRTQILSKLPKLIFKLCEGLAWEGVRRTLDRVN